MRMLRECFMQWQIWPLTIQSFRTTSYPRKAEPADQLTVVWYRSGCYGSAAFQKMAFQYRIRHSCSLHKKSHLGTFDTGESVF